MRGDSARPEWIDHLLEPAAYPHAVGTIRLVETHISRVFLTGPFAYKVKKPCRYPFVDFSTLDLRRHFCEEEVRLNRRFAPELYLGVVPIAGSPSSPRVGGDGEPFEWAVKLVQFDEADRLDARFEAGIVTAAECARLGTAIAEVQRTHAVSPPGSPFGTAACVEATAGMNLGEIARRRPDAAPRVERVGRWLRDRLSTTALAFAERIAGGRIRECHGDLHLANLLLLDGRPVAFDSIEFNAELRWIDVASDVAFLAMDLESRGRPDLAAHVVSAWMEAADDHAAAAVLPIHRAARAVVRAAVAAIRGAEAGCPAGVARVAGADCDRYLDLAERIATPSRPLLIATSGASGSGKTTVAAACIGAFGAVRLRSDVERKRLVEMAPTDRPADTQASLALYSTEMTDRVYRRLADLAGRLLAAGSSVVVDATCGLRRQRDLLAAVARGAGAGMVWIDLDLPETDLVARVVARREAGSDPSDATPDVVRSQLATREPFAADEASAAAAAGTPIPLLVRPKGDALANPDRLVAELAAHLIGPRHPEKRR